MSTRTAVQPEQPYRRMYPRLGCVHIIKASFALVALHVQLVRKCRWSGYGQNSQVYNSENRCIIKTLRCDAAYNTVVLSPAYCSAGLLFSFRHGCCSVVLANPNANVRTVSIIPGNMYIFLHLQNTGEHRESSYMPLRKSLVRYHQLVPQCHPHVGTHLNVKCFTCTHPPRIAYSSEETAHVWSWRLFPHTTAVFLPSRCVATLPLTPLGCLQSCMPPSTVAYITSTNAAHVAGHDIR